MAAEKSPPFSDLPVNPKYLHEDEELSQQCKDLISTLPTDSGWINVQLHQYNGFWFAKWHLQGILNCHNHFQPQDSDILLVTNPKSGTTWLKALAFAILNRHNNHYHNFHPLLTSNPHDLVPFLDSNLYYPDATPDLSSIPPPRLFATHLPYLLLPELVKNRSGCKIVYLCRNPKDVFVSVWHFANKIRSQTRGSISIEDSFDKFCRGVIGFGPVWDHMLGYYKESLERPEKVMFLRYEELKDEPVKVLKMLAKFMGSGFSEEEENYKVVENIVKLCSFESLSNLEVNKKEKTRFGVVNNAYFRNGEVGDWKNFLSLDMIKRLDDIAHEKLGKYGLKL